MQLTEYTYTSQEAKRAISSTFMHLPMEKGQSSHILAFLKREGGEQTVFVQDDFGLT